MFFSIFFRLILDDTRVIRIGLVYLVIRVELFNVIPFFKLLFATVLTLVPKCFSPVFFFY